MKKKKVLLILNKYAKQLSSGKLKVWSEDNDPENKCFNIPQLKLEKSVKKLDNYASIVAEFYFGSTEPMLIFRSRGKMSRIISSNVLAVKEAIVYQTFLHPTENEDNEKIMFEFMDRIQQILDTEKNIQYLNK